MKKSMTRKALSLMLVVMMLVSACITYTASAANLTITIGDGTTTNAFSSTADVSVLTDGVISGDSATQAVCRTGGSGVTNYVLSFDSAETFDTIKVYFSCHGPSWAFPGADKYAVTVNGAAAEVTFSSEEADSATPVAILTLAAPVTTTSAVVSVGNASWCNGVFEIAVENNAGAVDPDDSSVAEESSEDTSADDPDVVDPFDGKYFILASHNGKNVMINEDDQVRSFSIEDEPEDPNTVVWKFELKEDGYYKIINLGTGRILDVVDGLDYNGVVVKTWENNDRPAQRFSVSYEAVDAGEDFESAYVATLFPKCSTTRAVDIAAETGYLQLWDYTSDNTNQKFIMLEVPEDYFDEDTSADDSSADDSSADDVSGEVSEDTSDDTSTATEVNYAAGKKYTFESTKGFLDGYEDSGKLLTDGTVTNSEVKGQNVAVAGSGAVTDVVIDLGSKRTDIDKIVFGGVRIANNRQFAQVTLQVSNNGRSFTTIDASKYARIDNETGVGSYDIVFDLAEFATARYVKVSMLSDNYVLSMSEIKVIGYGADGGDVNPDDNENPGDAGIVTISIVALIALAGAVVVSKRRFN